MSRSLFAKIAAFIVGLALPLSMAAPASATVTTYRDIEERLAVLDLDADELRDRFADVDAELVTELETKLGELRSHGLDNADIATLAAGETVAGVKPGLLDGLLQTVLDLVNQLLEALGLGDALPDDDLPLPPDLPTAHQQEIGGLLDLGGLLDQVLTVVEELLAGLGLIELPDLPDAPDLPADAAAVQDLVDALMIMVVDLLASLGIIDAPDLPDLPELPEVPEVPDDGTETPGEGDAPGHHDMLSPQATH